jgi:hypothetical protein
MARVEKQYARLLQELASLMVGVAGESVTMVKRSAPQQALNVKKATEWTLYLEFMKVLFNLADRLSAFYVPVQEQPHFMDSLEDAVTNRLKTALAPALGQDDDLAEITLTIGNTVAESRKVYEQFRFVVTDESQARKDFFSLLANRVMELLGGQANGMVTSAATLCATAAIPAMKTLFEECAAIPMEARRAEASSRPSAAGIGNEIKLVSVMSRIRGEEIETRWGMHPRFRQDLGNEEGMELTRLMNEVTKVLGGRYAEVAFSSDWSDSQQRGHA